MKTTRILAFLIIVLLTVPIFTACDGLGNQQDDSSVPEDGYVPTYGGTFSFSIPSPATLNPIMVKRNSEQWEVINLIFEGLLQYSANLTPNRKLSTGWHFSPDGLTWTFYLRRGVDWHDGTPFTAQDVVFTYEMLRLHNIEYKEKLRNVRALSATNDFTFVVQWKEPQRSGLSIFEFPIIPRHHYRGKILEDSFANLLEPIGTGPYRFDSYLPKEYLNLRANEDWWDDRPYIDRVTFRIIPDIKAAQAAFDARQLDIIPIMPEQWNRYSAINGIKTFKEFQLGQTFISINHQNPILAIREVRQAIVHAIDRQKIVDEVLLGHGDIINSPISYLFDNEIMYEYNPSKAQELLEGIGFEKDERGFYLRLNPDTGRLENISLRIVTNQGNETRIKTARYVRDQLQAFGIEVTVETLPWRTIEDSVYRRRVQDSLLIEWIFSPEINLYSGFHRLGGLNFINYSNPELDEIIGQKQWNVNLRRAHEILAEDLPYIFLYRRHNLYAARDKFGNSPINPGPSGLLWNFPKWYMTKTPIE
jgi:peptide/nickel transport system substrate-binding protein